MLTKGSTVHITTEAGTDVTFDIEGRKGLSDDGRLREAGAFGNLPAGEGFIAPVEGKTNGRIVFDGSIWPMGVLDEPLTIDIVDGYARAFSGTVAEEFQTLLGPYGAEAFAVAELGIGTNEAAQLTGNVLEDEKILGTIHVAFGDNHSFGGVIRVSSHQDGVVLKPTVTVDSDAMLTQGRMLL
jgi:leucyl aminopeptidase (aminopeptidase T)